ncbi:hypothetical protein BsIDN1_39430 [Bacillus safensis]|uniref:indole-3-glycerol-phosphate synthase n=1 Tax=Bacillus safensis TaxID=561879 RepID=A0A5S9MBU0_BACIA|nr:hypothetical protein BsIDN1_39430 [Bacillus safensis]
MSRKKLHELYAEAKEKGLDVLVEVHAADTLENILKLFTPEIIGVNNRNLNTFTTTVEQTKEIAPLVPSDVLLVSESGIQTFDDLTFVKKHGAGAVLVGESLMREQSQEKSRSEIVWRMNRMKPYVKYCGAVSQADVECIAQSRANAIGFIFASSKRQVQPDQVKQWLIQTKCEKKRSPVYL